MLFSCPKTERNNDAASIFPCGLLPALQANVSKKQAERLVYTEDTYLSCEAAMLPFEKDPSFTEYQLVCTHDGNACAVCKGLDGETFSIRERTPGTNFPPMHPWCRCFFDVVVPDWKALTSGGRSGIIKEKDMFHTKDDPMREVLGSAEQSHPEELQQFFDYLSERKVVVIRRSDNSSMGYQPGLRRGEPGQIVMEDGASYSAWLHEVQHVKDDESEGWGGMATLFDRDKRWKMECNAYEKEIEFAQSLGRQDIVERLEILKENERKAIYGK